MKNIKPTLELARFYARHSVQYESKTAAARALGVNRTTYKTRLDILKDRFPEAFAADGNIIFKDATNHKCFIITSAQNSTKVHRRFFKNLEAYAKHKKAQLMISRFRYNVSARVASRKPGKEELPQEEWWDKAILPYLMDARVQLAEDLVLCGEVQQLPTAENPLSGLASHSGIKSAIYPHTKVAVESHPATLESTKILHTTGACTMQNYIAAKAGAKAEFHHIFGALIVEVDKKGKWQIRLLNAEPNGSFYDLHSFVSGGRVRKRTTSVYSINFGDIHLWKLDKKQTEGIFSLIKKLKPKYVFLHDLLDGDHISPHALSKPLSRQMLISRETHIGSELRQLTDFLQKLLSLKVSPVVVYSNHDHWLYRWLESQDWRSMPLSEASIYIELAREYLEYASDPQKKFHPLRSAVYLYSENVFNDVQFLTLDESFQYKGIEFGIHGHWGVNGARGSPMAFTRAGTKVNIGHSHSPTIKHGVYVAGTCTGLRVGYNHGLSSWRRAHIITYVNGKRTLYGE